MSARKLTMGPGGYWLAHYAPNKKENGYSQLSFKSIKYMAIPSVSSCGIVGLMGTFAINPSVSTLNTSSRCYLPSMFFWNKWKKTIYQ
jgi:hypothetical protein